MTDLISRAEAIKAFTGKPPEYYHTSYIIGELNDIPAVDAVLRRYGYWVEEPDRERHWHCSQCGAVQGMACLAMKYCPNCGADMAEHPWTASGCGQTFSPN